jgi:CheY-like chemotaxis protein
VIEDDVPILTLFGRSLELAGLRVTSREAPDCEPAEIASLAPDAVVLDLLFDPHRRRFGSADLGGPFLDRLKADPTTAAIPVVVCSADVPRLRRLAERMAHAGVVTLAKPCRPAELIAAVRSCLTSNSVKARSHVGPRTAAPGTAKTEAWRKPLPMLSSHP